MKKFYFYAINLIPTAKIHRFPTRKARQTWINEDPDNRGAVHQKGMNHEEHPAYFQVRRIQRMIAQGEKVTFPFELEG